MNAEIVARLDESLMARAREANMMDAVDRMGKELRRLVEHLEAIDPKFAAERKKHSDLAEETYARRTEEAKRAPAKTRRTSAPKDPRRKS
jgi:hypothetical protein